MQAAGADLGGVPLDHVRFANCNLRGASLEDVGWFGELKKCDLSHATIRSRRFASSSECKGQSLSVSGTKSSRCDVGELEDCDFDGATFEQCTIGQRIRGTSFEGATFRNCVMRYGSTAGTSFDGATFDAVEVESIEFTHVRFQGAQLAKTTWKNCNFEDCNFSEADFDGASLMNVAFLRCDFGDVDLGKTKLEGCTFEASVREPKGLNTKATKAGNAIAELEAALPTFKNVRITAQLTVGRKTLECDLYQFNHGFSPGVDYQAWLDGDELGRALTPAKAVERIAERHTNAKLVPGSLVVKASKGTSAPSHKPKAFKELVLAAWDEVLA